MMENTISKNVILYVIGIFILIIAILGVSYALFVFSMNGSKDNVIQTGTISMTYTEDTNGISIDNAYPISDDIGKVLNGKDEYFDFTVGCELSGRKKINYYVVAEKVLFDTDQLDDNSVRLYLEKKENNTYVTTPITSVPSPFVSTSGVDKLEFGDNMMLLYSSSFNNDSSSSKKFSDKFRLRMWISQDSKIDDIKRKFKIKVNVYSSDS